MNTIIKGIRKVLMTFVYFITSCTINFIMIFFIGMSIKPIDDVYLNLLVLVSGLMIMSLLNYHLVIEFKGYLK